MKKIKRIKNFQFHQVKFSDKSPTGYEWVQLLKAGEFLHSQAPSGKFQITKDTLKRMVANFDENVRRLKGRELAVDYSHEAGGKASGWIKSLALREDEDELWMEVDWTPNARQAIEEKEFRYISADIDFDYMDNESGSMFGPTLLGAGLTNRPHIKDMEIILNEQGVGMDLENIVTSVKTLSAEDKTKVMSAMGLTDGTEDKAQLETIETQLSEAKTSIETISAERDGLQTKVDEANKETLNLQKEAKFSEFLTQGKVTPSQKESFMKMELTLAEEFFKSAKGLHLSETGHGTEEGKTKTEDKSFEIQLDEKAAELMKATEGLTLREAYSNVLDANPELRKQYEGEV